MVNAIENATAIRVMKAEMWFIPGMQKLDQFGGQEVCNPQLGLHLGERGNRAQVGTQEADETHRGVITVPNSANIYLIGNGIPLSLFRLILLGEEGELLTVTCTKDHHVGLDHLLFEAMVLRAGGLAEDNGSILGDALRPRAKVNLSAVGIGNRHRDDGSTNPLNNAAVESVAVRLADIGRCLTRLGKEHLTQKILALGHGRASKRGYPLRLTWSYSLSGSPTSWS